MFWFVEVQWAHSLVVGWSMMLGEVVSIVVGARLPVDVVLALLDSVSKPVIAHVKSFGASLFDCASEDALGTGIVSLKGGASFGLGMA